MRCGVLLTCVTCHVGVVWGLMGIHQTAPGFSTFIVKPKLGGLEHASITGAWQRLTSRCWWYISCFRPCLRDWEDSGLRSNDRILRGWSCSRDIVQAPVSTCTIAGYATIVVCNLGAGVPRTGKMWFLRMCNTVLSALMLVYGVPLCPHYILSMHVQCPPSVVTSTWQPLQVCAWDRAVLWLHGWEYAEGDIVHWESTKKRPLPRPVEPLC